jgi:DNA-binding transcriptional LysR family regulator
VAWELSTRGLGQRRGKLAADPTQVGLPAPSLAFITPTYGTVSGSPNSAPVGRRLHRVADHSIHLHGQNEPSDHRVDAGAGGDGGVDRQQQRDARGQVGDCRCTITAASTIEAISTRGAPARLDRWPEAAASGLGVAIGSYPLVAHDLAAGRLVAPYGFVASRASYCLLHPRDTAKVPKVAALRSRIAAEAGRFIREGERGAGRRT